LREIKRFNSSQEKCSSHPSIGQNKQSSIINKVFFNLFNILQMNFIVLALSSRPFDRADSRLQGVAKEGREMTAACWSPASTLLESL